MARGEVGLVAWGERLDATWSCEECGSVMLDAYVRKREGLFCLLLGEIEMWVVKWGRGHRLSG